MLPAKIEDSYEIYLDSQFPAGTFRRTSTRKGVMMSAFLQRAAAITGRDFSDLALMKSECAIVRAPQTKQRATLPWLTIYHKSLPVVRLYRQKTRYSLHVLRGDCALWDLVTVVLFDPVGSPAELRKAVTKQC